MIRWVQLASATMPDNGGELRLMQRGSEYSIMSGPIELMNSRLSGSETALATLAFDAIGGRPAARILIGGLGMGFTLLAAQAAFADDAAMTVSEIVPAVSAWARGPLADLYAGSLDDARVTLHDGDVSGLIRAGEAVYDAILLDVDNGPQGLTRKENDRLYSIAGLYAARRALTPGGVLAVWSAAPSAAFVQRLRDAGFTVEEVGVRANGAKGARHLIWMARSPGIG